MSLQSSSTEHNGINLSKLSNSLRCIVRGYKCIILGKKNGLVVEELQFNFEELN